MRGLRSAVLLAGLGLFACDAEPIAVEPSLTPAERLDRLAPGLAKEAARYTDDLGALADVLERAHPSLRRFLLPKDSGWLPDELDELASGPDITWSKMVRERQGAGWRYTGHVEGVGLDRLQIYVDNRGGPAPDLRFDLPVWRATTILQANVIPGGTAVENTVVVPGQAWHDDHGWDFSISIDAGPLGERPTSFLFRALGPGDGGDSPGRDEVDDAAGGTFGATGQTVRLVVALLDGQAGPVDADLVVAVAATWGPWLDLVDAGVAPQVLADARARLAYADEVDLWLSEQAGDSPPLAWRVHALGPVQKMLWAWPGGEGSVYGARPLGWEAGRLSAEAYRFHVADIETLRALRDELPLGPDEIATADARDSRVWADLAYRADDAGMEALCDQKRLDRSTCFAWERDRAEGRSLGAVDGVPVPLHKGTSASFQADRWLADGSFSGDCASATSVMIAALQAVGLSPLALGWAGETWFDPTHNLPLVWDGERFRATQAGPSGKWNGQAAFVYAPLPALNAHGLMLGWAGFGAAGPAVAGGQTTYGELNDWLDAGVTADTVLHWLAAAHEGGWPQIP
ncbi:MAG: hypothetical protein EXR69_00715 [Myxococcales bacterium]|nr:hypothetical protein [Myxococcales bacterium]